ncbi:RnfABCDGE type electron transport complex subunit B [Haliangium sp.]|uniref:RnfABCDGE type electron transport complex subunit B n=1 Tax=Haliangium sp. TaxID=2663208 RepID=UPI003D0B34FF
MPPVLTAVITVGALTMVLATLLVVANRKLFVEEDPRIDLVEDMLPHANCGACGFPGCRPFAEALVSGKVLPGLCTVSSEDGRVRIASFLGVDVGAQEKQVARLACAGGDNVARNHARYQGLSSCAAATLVSGGGKGCSWGCLGLGDCVVACDFDALHMNAHSLPVVDVDKCTACGDCVTACPKDLFSIHAIGHKLWVNCKSELAGDEILADCEVACTACGRCAMDAPKLVTMRDNLPVIDYAAVRQAEGQGGREAREARESAARTSIERCPTGAIVWLEGGRLVKGGAAKKIIRQGARPEAPT